MTKKLTIKKIQLCITIWIRPFSVKIRFLSAFHWNAVCFSVTWKVGVLFPVLSFATPTLVSCVRRSTSMARGFHGNTKEGLRIPGKHLPRSCHINKPCTSTIVKVLYCFSVKRFISIPGNGLLCETFNKPCTSMTVSTKFSKLIVGSPSLITTWVHEARHRHRPEFGWGQSVIHLSV